MCLPWMLSEVPTYHPNSNPGSRLPKQVAQRIRERGANQILTPKWLFTIFISLVRQDPRAGEIALLGDLSKFTYSRVLFWVPQVRHFWGPGRGYAHCPLHSLPHIWSEPLVYMKAQGGVRVTAQMEWRGLALG